MLTDERFMQRCIDLARLGQGYVAPNPMVGAVVVYNGKIIGEGYHHKFGAAHAEVEAIQSVKEQQLLAEATVYVSLEPCAHVGKTPPCADLLIEKHVKKVVIGCDIRLSSEGLKQATIRGLNDAGVNVLDLGMTGTEEVYFGAFHLDVQGGIEVTASHNPMDYNGMKLVRE
jgi:diaminohydroxyphosphoribosylaminopyrimidine deaminase/5-amino-6-(5-phosphoribosylamino)uracil reductase